MQITPFLLTVPAGVSAAAEDLCGPFLRAEKEEGRVVHVPAADIRVGEVVEIALLIFLAHAEGVEDMDLCSRNIDLCRKLCHKVGVELVEETLLFQSPDIGRIEERFEEGFHFQFPFRVFLLQTVQVQLQPPGLSATFYHAGNQLYEQLRL